MGAEAGAKTMKVKEHGEDCDLKLPPLGLWVQSQDQVMCHWGGGVKVDEQRLAVLPKGELLIAIRAG